MNPENSVETRIAVAKVRNFVNWFPNITSILMLPVGLMLAAGRGISPIEGSWLVLPWILSGTWLLILVGTITQRGTSIGKIYGNLDYLIRYVLIAVLIFSALLSFFGEGPFGSNWLALKILIYAYVLICSLGIRFTAAASGPAFGRLITEGSTPEIEEAIKKPAKRVKPWVLGLWAGLLAMALLGIAQPSI